MSIRIANALGIVREVLENHYPGSEVKVGESGSCDYRVSSVGATIYVNDELEEDVVEEILEKSKEELDNRKLELAGKNEDKTQFDMTQWTS